MTTAEDIWNKLTRSKEYREEFALALLKRSVAFQIKTLRKKHCGSQAILAERSKLTQGVVSRAEDQDYGNLTFNTVGRIAGGLDMAFIGTFVSYEDLVRFSVEMSEDRIKRIPTFAQEAESKSGVTVKSESRASERKADAQKTSHAMEGAKIRVVGPLGSALSVPDEEKDYPQGTISGQMKLDLLPGNVHRMPPPNPQSDCQTGAMGAAFQRAG